ncbi:hypothetical protein Cgig2_011429 [Carnegiea gigantea]|uniref:RRM domain-containing protein n=1 Tax=Carnegiea gigantea TaxID=171969 RepID=A0A9Q1KSJ6_9CARY|nr:hypothetical protein Cgig2_011429 [Carnegiea gigantea]
MVNTGLPSSDETNSADSPLIYFKMSHHILRSNDFRSPSIDPVRRDVSLVSSGVYGLDDLSGYGVRIEPVPHGLAAGISTRSYPSSLEDPIVTSETQDLCARISPMPAINPDLLYERPPSQRRVDGLPVSPGESNILFVDGLPTDCTRREVGRILCVTLQNCICCYIFYIFRPFIGFKDIKVIHKVPRRVSANAEVNCLMLLLLQPLDLTMWSEGCCTLVLLAVGLDHLLVWSGDKAMVLCFVEFNDSKCALTAMNALQGYKFDDKKPNSPVLRIHFVHFPFRLPSEHDDQRLGTR